MGNCLLVVAKNHHSEVQLRALQKQIAADDQQAFAALYGLFYRKLNAFAFSLVRSKEISEDVVEEVFIKLWVNRRTINTVNNIAVYLYVAVKNQALNKLSEKARKLIYEPFDGFDPPMETLQDDPFTMLVTGEMLASLNKAIEDLPPRCKMIFKLVREEGLRYREVAEILNISVNTIDAQMAIAVKRLCQALGLPQKRQKTQLKTISGHNTEKNETL